MPSGPNESLVSQFWWSQYALKQSTDEQWAAVLNGMCLIYSQVYDEQSNQKILPQVASKWQTMLKII